MILFEEDWAKYPTAIIDTETKNKSFLRVAALYKKRGIKNCYFMLALHNPRLQGVDPYDPNLTEEQIADIIVEASFNPWYCFRELIWFPGMAGSDKLMFEANRANIAMYWSYYNHVMFALTMPRQFGKSGSSNGLHVVNNNIQGRGSRTRIVTKDEKLRKSNIEALKGIRDNLPWYLNIKDRADANNTEEVTCKAFKNYIQISIARNSESGADNLGRGMTEENVHIDEFPWCAKIHVTLPVVLAAASKIRQIAEQVGSNYGTIFTTTAGKRDTEEGSYAFRIFNSAMPMNEIIYDLKDREELHNYIKKQSVDGETLLINGTFSHRQLGKTDAWIREEIKKSMADRLTALRDWLNFWTSGTATSPLENTVLENIRNSQKDPEYTEINKHSYGLDWYIYESQIDSIMASEPHVITLDSSNAVGRDANALFFISSVTGKVTASSRVSEANLLRYGSWLAELMIRFPNTVLIPENKSSGQALLDIIVTRLIAAGHNPFKRIYNRIVDDKTTPAMVLQDVLRNGCNHNTYLEHKGKFGFMTTGDSRAFLYGQMLTMAGKMFGHGCHSSVLIGELMGLVVKNNRVDHGAGGHDDTVISWLLGVWLLNYGRSLSTYGLDPTRTLSLLTPAGAEDAEKALEKRREQAKLRAMIEVTRQLFINAKDSISEEVARLKLVKLVIEANSDGGDIVNLDNLLSESETEVKKAKPTLMSRLKRFR